MGLLPMWPMAPDQPPKMEVPISEQMFILVKLLEFQYSIVNFSYPLR
jgi:hypothetical protein